MTVMTIEAPSFLPYGRELTRADLEIEARFLRKAGFRIKFK